jgi:hypothetical protein
VKTGTPGFNIPAFSAAIFSIESPRMCVCSRLIEVIITATGVKTFVASSLPPNPVSITA